jgi:hypothetical protein
MPKGTSASRDRATCSSTLYALINGSGSSSGENVYSNFLIDSASNSQVGCSYISVDGATYTSGCG